MVCQVVASRAIRWMMGYLVVLRIQCESAGACVCRPVDRIGQIDVLQHNILIPAAMAE